MTSVISTRPWMTMVAVLGLCAATGCASSGPEGGGQTQSNVNGACAAESEDGEADKILCSIDTDCDSDEVCMEGKCIGLDGEAEDGDACDGADDADDDADDAGDADDDANDDDADDDADEGGADKIYCATDADCDSDEVCVNGKCD